jgi:hypothetical protein
MKKLLHFLLLAISFSAWAQGPSLPLPYPYKNVRVPAGPPDYYLHNSATDFTWSSTASILANVSVTERFVGQLFQVGNPWVWYTFASSADLASGTLTPVVTGGSSSGWAVIGTTNLTGNTFIQGNSHNLDFSGIPVLSLNTSNAGVTTSEVRDASGYSLTNVDANSSDNAPIHLYTGGFSGSTAVDITSNNGFLVTTSGDVNVSGGVSGGANSASSVVIRNYLLNVSKLFTAKQRFTVNSTNAGINLGTFAGDPSTLVNGDIWYNSSIPSVRARVGGSTISLGTGGSSYTVTAPITLTGVDIGITNAQADASTKGAATFTTNDFNDNGSGTISLDYTNAQKATGSIPGLLSASDFTTFTAKQAALSNGNGTTVTGGNKVDIGGALTANATITGAFDLNLNNTKVHLSSLAATATRAVLANSSGDLTYSGNFKFNDTGVFSYPTLTIGSATNAALELQYASGGGTGIVVTSDTGVPQFTFGVNGSANYGGSGRTYSIYDAVESGYRFGINSSGDTYIGTSNSSYGVKFTQSGTGTYNDKVILNYSGSGNAIAGNTSGVDQFYIAFDGNSNYGGTGRTVSIYDPVSGGYRLGVNSLGDFTVGNTNSSYGLKTTQAGVVNINTSAYIGGTSSATSTLQVAGSFAPATRTITAAATLQVSDYTVRVDATAGNTPITLPTASACLGRIYVIKKVDATANTVTFTADGGTVTLSTLNKTYTIQSNGTTFDILSVY